MAASVRESLARLQIPYIDIIQCHDIEFGSLDQVCRAPRSMLQGSAQHSAALQQDQLIQNMHTGVLRGCACSSASSSCSLLPLGGFSGLFNDLGRANGLVLFQ